MIAFGASSITPSSMSAKMTARPLPRMTSPDGNGVRRYASAQRRRYFTSRTLAPSVGRM